MESNILRQGCRDGIRSRISESNLALFRARNMLRRRCM
uniref:Uncharacterized protein n=1 Tax=Arundo donax TaxID=35708 RepID=A0A0A9H817_ARUDO